MVLLATLRSYLPDLADALEVPQVTLYERMRELTRQGLLDRPTGTGRGSGTDLNARQVSVLLIATLAFDGLAEAASRTRELAALRATKGICPLTAQRTFQTAFTHILEGLPGRTRLLSLEVSRPARSAVIRYSIGTKVGKSDFGPLTTSPPLTVIAAIKGSVIEIISAEILSRTTKG